MRRGFCLVLLILLLAAGMPLMFAGIDEEACKMTEEEQGPFASRATLVVGPGQTYTRIQDAIDNATAGDTVRVWAGMYNESVVVTKSLNIIGNGTDQTILSSNTTYIFIEIKNDLC